MKCQALDSCDREADYLLRRRHIAVETYACRVHACMFEDAGMLISALRIDSRTAELAAKRAQRRADGGCWECTAPAVLGQIRCERHRVTHNRGVAMSRGRSGR